MRHILDCADWQALQIDHKRVASSSNKRIPSYNEKKLNIICFICSSCGCKLHLQIKKETSRLPIARTHIVDPEPRGLLNDQTTWPGVVHDISTKCPVVGAALGGPFSAQNGGILRTKKWRLFFGTPLT